MAAIDAGERMSMVGAERVGEFDIWIVPNFAQTELKCDPKALQEQLEDRYPVRGNGDVIEWARPQWVEGDNEALRFRGRELKRGKMWFQVGEPKTDGFVKYYYTGWQNAILPATCNVERAPELAAVVKEYNNWAGCIGYAHANHFIVTHYVDGEHSIGMHFDKPKSIAKESLITIVKTGKCGRPFRLELLDGSLLLERVLAPGTAVIMTLEANLKTKHGVPAVAEADSSGSIVFRTITDRVQWDTLERNLSKFYTGKKRQANLKTKHCGPAVAEADSSDSIVFRTITDRVQWEALEGNLSKFYTGKKRKAEVTEATTADAADAATE